MKSAIFKRLQVVFTFFAFLLLLINHYSITFPCSSSHKEVKQFSENVQPGLKLEQVSDTTKKIYPSLYRKNLFEDEELPLVTYVCDEYKKIPVVETKQLYNELFVTDFFIIIAYAGIFFFLKSKVKNSY